MSQKEIKFVYEIHSSIDLDDILETLHNELKLKKGTIRYFSLLQDDMAEKDLLIERLKQKVQDIFSDDEYPTLISPNVEVSVDEDEIEIVSKIELKLKNIDVDKIIKP